MISSREVEHENPICPHCEKEVRQVLYKQVQSTFGKRYMYFCDNCKKVLGVTQRKGFWMG